MAITSLDQLVAALPGQRRPLFKASATAKAAGTWQSLLTAAGQPGAGVYPGASAAWSVQNSARAGAIPFVNGAGAAKSYLARLEAAGATAGTLIIYDRLAETGSLPINANGTTALTAAALTRPDALGGDVELWLEWITPSSNHAGSIGMTYTNQAGTAGRLVAATALQAVSVAGQMQPMLLASGDTGVRSVQDVTISGTTFTSGAYQLVLLRRVAEMPMPLANAAQDRDPFALGLPEIYNDACLMMMVLASTTATGVIQAACNIAQG